MKITIKITISTEQKINKPKYPNYKSAYFPWLFGHLAKTKYPMINQVPLLDNRWKFLGNMKLKDPYAKFNNLQLKKFTHKRILFPFRVLKIRTENKRDLCDFMIVECATYWEWRLLSTGSELFNWLKCNCFLYAKNLACSFPLPRIQWRWNVVCVRSSISVNGRMGRVRKWTVEIDRWGSVRVYESWKMLGV